MTHATPAPLFENIPDDVLHLFENGQPHARKVVDLLEYQKKDVAAATKLPLSSVRYDSKMPEELRERIREWAVAINLVGQFFKDEQKTLLWFRVSNPLLGGESPRAMIRAGRFKKLRKFIETALAENLR